MAKKALILTLSFACSTSAMAHYPAHSARPYQFYAGVNSGASFYTNQSTDTFLSVSGFTLSDRETSDARGYNGGIVLGYNFYCHCNMVLGAEFSANMYTNRGAQTLHFYEVSSFTSRNFEISHDMQYSWHLTLRPSFCINPCNSIYMNAGIGFARLNFRTDNKDTASASPYPIRQEDNENVYGLTLGVGFNHRLTTCTSFFTEYQYTHYGDATLKEFKLGGTLATPDGRLTNRSATIDTNVFKIGFSYNF